MGTLATAAVATLGQEVQDAGAFVHARCAHRTADRDRSTGGADIATGAAIAAILAIILAARRAGRGRRIDCDWSHHGVGCRSVKSWAVPARGVEPRPPRPTVAGQADHGRPTRSRSTACRSPRTRSPDASSSDDRAVPASSTTLTSPRRKVPNVSLFAGSPSILSHLGAYCCFPLCCGAEYLNVQKGSPGIVEPIGGLPVAWPPNQYWQLT